MPLFNIQDVDRPMFVSAADYGAAVEKYLQFISTEYEYVPVEDLELPQGVQFVCDDDELLL